MYSRSLLRDLTEKVRGDSFFTSSQSSQTPSDMTSPGQTVPVLFPVKQEQTSIARWEHWFVSGSPQDLSCVTQRIVEDEISI